MAVIYVCPSCGCTRRASGLEAPRKCEHCVGGLPAKPTTQELLESIRSSVRHLASSAQYHTGEHGCCVYLGDECLFHLETVEGEYKDAKNMAEVLVRVLNSFKELPCS